ncbi:type I polyketide synthase [Paenibacillus sp. HW567]|uniref:type I polyketide synthase n=1 Tax=Paenibacillus sp. HW567 TaxID=1034769 RepID=UPI00037F249B|nr:type I polyketide synthase [Paenibacillus sp. HW567]
MKDHYIWSYEEICHWFVLEIGKVSKKVSSDIDIYVTFDYLGLDSQTLVSLTGALGSWLQKDIDPTVLWEYPSIHLAALYFAKEPDSERTHETIEKMQSDNGIAIVGMACRFPNSPNLAAFWRNLQEGKDCITEIPGSRAEEFSQAGIRYAGLIDGMDLFDNEAFRISPREAEQMDPQQRILLEVTAEALDDAGLTDDHLNGSRTGVYIGISSNDYGYDRLSSMEHSSVYTMTGNAQSIAANRISYIWNLRGPSMAIDTACSSSLVAVHLACQSLQTEESDIAIVGGVNLLLTPAISNAFYEAGMLAADGRCKTFSADADGYVRGEGAGTVILKRLDSAVRDHDRIYGVIRGCAVNQDGLSNGLTAPSGMAQTEVISAACRKARIQPNDLDYIEAHGTGTPLGDPIEVKALGAVLSRDREASRPCALGSVKTNIGHLEAAAGIAGLIKTALCLHYREWVPSLHMDKPNPYIPFEELPLKVVKDNIVYGNQENGRLLHAGVSAFGFGGTNAHVVLEEYRLRRDAASTDSPEQWMLLPISARSLPALQNNISDMKRLLHNSPAERFLDIAYTAQSRRTHHSWRLSVLGRNTEEWIEQLNQCSSPSRPSNRKSSGVLFVYSGQGTQWSGMGLALLKSQPAFKKAFLECDQLWNRLSGWSLLQELNTGNPTNWNERTDIAQPLTFAVQVALSALWKSHGIVPEAAVGHSLGEISACYTAGVISLENALTLVYWRSQLMQSSYGKGAMLAVCVPHEELKQLLMSGQWSSLDIAAVNSGTLTVIAGSAGEVELFRQSIQESTHSHYISRHFAFHSSQMEIHFERLMKEIAEVKHKPARIRWYSTVSGGKETGLRLPLTHWQDNMRCPVRFAEALSRAKDDGYHTIVEIGAHPALMFHLEDLYAKIPNKLLLYSSRRMDEERIFLDNLSKWYESGGEILWTFTGSRCVSLPAYSWNHQSFWAQKSNGSLSTSWPPASSKRVTEMVQGGGAVESDKQGSIQAILEAREQPDLLQPLLESYLQSRFAEILKLRDTAKFPHDKILIEMGLDSIMALQIKNEMERAFGVFIPIAEFIGGMTTRKAANELSRLLQEQVASAAAPNEPLNQMDILDSLESGVVQIEELSDEEIDRLLLLLADDPR